MNRTISMQNKYFNGVISNPLEQEDIDKELIALALDTPKRVKRKWKPCMSEKRLMKSLPC